MGFSKNVKELMGLLKELTAQGRLSSQILDFFRTTMPGQNLGFYKLVPC